MRGVAGAAVLGGLGAVLSVPRLRRLLSRWLTILRLSGRSSARAAAHQVRRYTVDEDQRGELDVAFQLRTAGDVAATLGAMKGVFMKVGQLASFVDDAMPEHVRTALAQLQDSAPPMAPELAKPATSASSPSGTPTIRSFASPR